MNMNHPWWYEWDVKIVPLVANIYTAKKRGKKNLFFIDSYFEAHTAVWCHMSVWYSGPCLIFFVFLFCESVGSLQLRCLTRLGPCAMDRDVQPDDLDAGCVFCTVDGVMNAPYSTFIFGVIGYVSNTAFFFFLFFFLIYSVSYFYGMLYRFSSLLQCTKSCYPKWIFIDNDMRRKIKLGLQMSHCPLFTTLVLIQPSRQQSVFGTETLPWVPCG